MTPTEAAAQEANASGFYIGSMAGFGVARSTGSQTDLPAGLPAISARTATTPSDSLTPSLSLLAGRAWQITDRLFVGIEADASIEDARGSWSGLTKSDLPGMFGYFSDDLSANSTWSMAWQGALRARLAYALTPGLSVYGSIGPALGDARLQTSLNEHYQGFIIPNSVIDNRYQAGFARTDLRPGISADVGLETALASGLSLRVGYSVSAFQPISQQIALPSASNATGTIQATPLLQFVRLGLIKRF